MHKQTTRHQRERFLGLKYGMVLRNSAEAGLGWMGLLCSVSVCEPYDSVFVVR